MPLTSTGRIWFCSTSISTGIMDVASEQVTKQGGLPLYRSVSSAYNGRKGNLELRRGCATFHIPHFLSIMHVVSTLNAIHKRYKRFIGGIKGAKISMHLTICALLGAHVVEMIRGLQTSPHLISYLRPQRATIQALKGSLLHPVAKPC